MSELSSDPGVQVGIDVSKEFLDCFATPGRRMQFSNDEAGCHALCAWLRPFAVERIIIEATGGYEAAAVATLGAAQLPVIVVNPRQVRAFAKALGQLAKTDLLDAEVLARFGAAVKPEIRPLKDEQTQELEGLLARRRQLLDMLVAERQRLTRAAPRVRADLKAHITWLVKRLKESDRGLHDFLQESPLWREREDLLSTVQGVGKQTVYSLCALLPELGTLSSKRLAALAGIAPFNCDSGTFRGKRRCFGGRATLRCALYMATVTAIRCNPVIQPFYQRLVTAGKPKKVAIVACMRKLLTILNAMVRDNSPWDPMRYA
jgi:transposase